MPPVRFTLSLGTAGRAVVYSGEIPLVRALRLATWASVLDAWRRRATRTARGRARTALEGLALLVAACGVLAVAGVGSAIDEELRTWALRSALPAALVLAGLVAWDLVLAVRDAVLQALQVPAVEEASRLERSREAAQMVYRAMRRVYQREHGLTSFGTEGRLGRVQEDGSLAAVELPQDLEAVRIDAYGPRVLELSERVAAPPASRGGRVAARA